MSRYFFHVHDDVVASDEDGIELPDAEAARLEAIAGLRSLAADQVKEGRLDLRHFIEIEDEAGAPVATIVLGDIVRVES
jgi:hypothetical protein